MIVTAKVAASTLRSPLLRYESGRWMLYESYEYRDGERVVRVRGGFRFDLASVPRALWWLIAPFELSIVAPLLHDWLYFTTGHGYSRKDADDLFRRVMKEEGVPAWRREAAYRAVRVFGRFAWRA